MRMRIDDSENPTNRSFVGRLSVEMDDDDRGSVMRKADDDEECDDERLDLMSATRRSS